MDVEVDDAWGDPRAGNFFRRESATFSAGNTVTRNTPELLGYPDAPCQVLHYDACDGNTNSAGTVLTYGKFGRVGEALIFPAFEYR